MGTPRLTTGPPAMKTHLIRFWVAAWIGALFAAGAVPSLSWTNNLLTFHDDRLPSGRLEVFYLEAFLRPGAHDRDWGGTTVRHRTRLLSVSPDGRELRFQTDVEPAVEVLHTVRIVDDGLSMDFSLTNRGSGSSPIQWFQPACIRVAAFTGKNQTNFTSRSFVFTAGGQTPLDQLHRTTNALYLGGQVFLPPWTLAADANPRPLASDRLANGLIGCTSADNHWILAIASDRTHELFEGVYVCLHSDPLIGGLKSGESRQIRQRVYLVTNDVPALLQRYRRDFPPRPDGTY